MKAIASESFKPSESRKLGYANINGNGPDTSISANTSNRVTVGH